MASTLYFPPTQNGLQKQLDAQLDEGTTASLTLNNVTGVQNKKGIVVINRIDSNGALLSSSVREFISFTGTSGNTLTGLTRGLAGSTDQDHAIGSIVEFIWDVVAYQALVDKLTGTDTVALEDTNGNEMLKTSTTTSAVNEFTIKNAATGNGPEIQATGGDTNIPVVIQPKGTGATVIKGTADSAAELRLNEDTDNGTNYIGLKAPASVATSKTFVLPDADGSAGQFLKTDGSATLSWGTGLGSTTQYLPTPTLINGQIVPSVASNNLTVALKGMDGNDPSASNPVYVRLGNTVRTVTSALSVTKNAGTNWFNSGSADLATKEIDYFVYLGYNATDGVVIGFSRIPYAKEYDDFSATSTNDKYCAISTITNAAAGDDYEVVGRFAATLSAGAGYTWTVPTFTNKNLIQRPIYNTRWLTNAQAGVSYSFQGDSLIFTGWGWMLGDVSSDLVETVSFGFTVTAVLSVIVSFIGYKDSSDPSTIYDFVSGYYAICSSGTAITTSGFDAVIQEVNANNFANTRRFGYSWLATCTL